MAYTQELGRRFWLAFDDYFKFGAASNGLAAYYNALGARNYQQPSLEWTRSRAGGTPDSFKSYVDARRDTFAFLASEQKRMFDEFLPSPEWVISAFQDFAYGVLASPTAPNRQNEPVHTMNGGIGAQDYLSWHGFIEAANHLRLDPAFWERIRWVNGMGWELQAKARPQEVFPNLNRPLAPEVTAGIRQKWEARSAADIATEFDNYATRPSEWMLA